MKRLFLILLGIALPLAGQELERGDVLVSTSGGAVSRVLVYSRDGDFKREFVSSQFHLRESLVRGDTVYVASELRILTFDRRGTPRGPFGQTGGLVYLSPAADGSVIGANGSGELYQLGPDGAIRWRREAALSEPLAHGVDLAPDQCSVFSITSGSVGQWNLCRDTPPRLITPLRASPAGTALRMLADGGFLISYRTDVERLDSTGNTIRTYRIPCRGIALDVDGTSFWVGADGSLLNVDIATGAIQKNIFVGEAVAYLSVVDEPRAALAGAAIPTLDPFMLALLAVAMIIVSIIRTR